MRKSECVCVLACVFLCEPTHTSLCVFLCAHMHACLLVYMCSYVQTCMHVCVYKGEREREKEEERKTLTKGPDTYYLHNSRLI